MSLGVFHSSITSSRFPRVSGDEPSDQALRQAVIAFSPRERG